jgi:cytochrome c oxidase subunit 3
MDNSLSMEQTSFTEEKRQIRQKTAQPLLWVAIVSMIMIFASLTSAYVVRMGKGDWLHFELPRLFYVSTAIIIVSSVTMNWAYSAVKKNNLQALQKGTLLTLLLGFAFAVSQFFAWVYLYEQKIVFAGKYSNAAGSFLYFLTALHLAHLAAGLMSLTVVWVKALRGKYDSENFLGVKLCAIFWHFLDVLWILLFLFLLIWR